MLALLYLTGSSRHRLWDYTSNIEIMGALKNEKSTLLTPVPVLVSFAILLSIVTLLLYLGRDKIRSCLLPG